MTVDGSCPPQQTDLDYFVALESSVWEALKTGEKSIESRLLADDFIGVYASGVEAKQDHIGQLDDGPTVLNYEIEQPQLHRVQLDAVLLIYQASWWRPARPDIPYRYHISSLWQYRDGRWRNRFSQDTAVEP